MMTANATVCDQRRRFLASQMHIEQTISMHMTERASILKKLAAAKPMRF